MRASIKSTLLAYSVGVALIPVAIMAVLVSYMQTRIVKTADEQFESVAVDNARRIALDMYGMCSLVQKSRDDSVARKRVRFYLLLEKFGLPSVGEGSLTAEARNLLEPSAPPKTLKAPALMLGKTPLTKEEGLKKFLEAIRSLKAGTQTEYALFVRANEEGDMLVLSSTFEAAGAQEEGAAYLPGRMKSGAQTPQVAEVLKGRVFRGLFELGANVMIGNLEPVFDENQNVIGAIFLGVGQNIIEELCKYMEGVRIGKNGFVWALENEDADKSVFRVSRDGKMNGTVMQLDENSGRRKNFMQIIESAARLPEGESGLSVYTIDSGSARQKRVTCYTYFRPWNWVIGATAYTEDFERGRAIVREQSDSVLDKLGYGAAFVILSGLVFAWLIVGRLGAGLSALKGIGESLTSGNLRAANEKIRASAKTLASSPIRETFEQFEAVKQMSEKIGEIVSKAQAGVEALGKSSFVMKGCIRELDRFIARQGALVREVSDGTKGMRARTDRLSRLSVNAAEDVRRTLSTARQSAEGLDLLRENSETLLAAAERIVSTLSLINSNAEKISDAVAQISSLSEKTNLLSLNASVEAENAGEAGLGFSVVAREIRRLANRTSSAGKDIERMAREMQSAVGGGVMEMDRFDVRMRESAESIGGAISALEGVVAEISALSPQFDALSAEIERQSQKAEGISGALEGIGQTAAPSAERVGALRRAAEGAAAAGAELRDEISAFGASERGGR